MQKLTQYCGEYDNSLNIIKEKLDHNNNYIGQTLTETQIMTLYLNIFPNNKDFNLNNVSKNNIFYFLTFKDIPIGMFNLTVLTNYTAFLSDFGIHTDYRNKGIGKLLFYKVISICKNLKLTLIFDSISNDNIKKFYLSTDSKIINENNNSIHWINNY